MELALMEVLRRGFLLSLFIIPQACRNVVVAPGRILRISGLISQVLLRLLLGIVMPGVLDFLR